MLLFSIKFLIKDKNEIFESTVKFIFSQISEPKPKFTGGKFKSINFMFI